MSVCVCLRLCMCVSVCVAQPHELIIELWWPFCNAGQPEYAVRRDASDTGEKAEPTSYKVIVVGAGAAGLSLAGRLERRGISYVVFEKDVPGSAWDNRYDRLHLHTVRGISQLPYWGFPDTAPTFVSRRFLAKYYRAYASMHNVKSHSTVVKTEFNESEELWHVTVRCGSDGSERTYTSNVLAVCTGQEATPNVPQFKGQASFPGTIFHSQHYKNGSKLRDSRVLVVGFGNSGSEMSLDLWEWGAKPTVRAMCFAVMCCDVL